MHNAKFDSTFGVKSVALSVAHLVDLDRRGFEGLTNITWSPFYNGRERGVCLTVRANFHKPGIAIVWGEHRSSDDIYVDTFPVDSFMNPPTMASFTEEIYNLRKTFRYNEVYKVVDHVYELVRQHIEACKEPA